MEIPFWRGSAQGTLPFENSIFRRVGRHMPSRKGILFGTGALVAGYSIGHSSGASGLRGRSTGTQGMYSPGGQMFQ